MLHHHARICMELLLLLSRRHPSQLQEVLHRLRPHSMRRVRVLPQERLRHCSGREATCGPAQFQGISAHWMALSYHERVYNRDRGIISEDQKGPSCWNTIHIHPQIKTLPFRRPAALLERLRHRHLKQSRRRRLQILRGKLHRRYRHHSN